MTESGNNSSTDMEDGDGNDGNERLQEGEEDNLMLKLKPNTARQYGQCMAYFTVWCYQHRRELVVPALRARMDTSGATVNTVRKYCALLLDGSPPMLELSKIQVDDFIHWFDDIVLNSEERVTQSQFARHRKAFRALFACQGIRLPKQFSSELSQKITLFLKRNGYHYLPHLLPPEEAQREGVPEKRPSRVKAAKRPRRSSKAKKSFDEGTDSESESEQLSVTEDEDFEAERNSYYIARKRSKEGLHHPIETDIKLEQEGYPLTQQSFRRLCALTIEEEGHNISMPHACLVYAWNLPCRIDELANIPLCNISTEGNAVVVTSVDSTGKNRRKYICSNPQVPVLCPVLALAMYVCDRDTNFGPSSDKKLFPASVEKNLLNSIQSSSVLTTMAREGLQDPLKIKAESFVNGVSCIAHGDLSSKNIENALLERLGNGASSNNVAAEDKRAAKFLAGWPEDLCDTECDAPHFDNACAAEDSDITSALIDSFDKLPDSLMRLRLLLLASIVYHSDFVQVSMGPRYTSQIPLFTNRERLKRLRGKVICGQKDSMVRQTETRSAQDSVPQVPKVGALTAPNDPRWYEWINSMQNNIRLSVQRSLASVNDQLTHGLEQLNAQLMSATEFCQNGSQSLFLAKWKDIHSSFDSMKAWNQSASLEIQRNIEQYEQRMLEHFVTLEMNGALTARSPVVGKKQDSNQSSTAMSSSASDSVTE